MRALSHSLILALTLVVSGISGISIAGSADASLPHAGLFQMNPSQPLVIASR